MTQINDEHIDDWLYSQGWKQVSTQDGCSEEGCKCISTGRCAKPMFNHYMVEEYNPSPISCGSSCFDTGATSEKENEAPADTFPICITQESVDTIGVEEVRCRRHTVGICYRYYKANVIKRGIPMTMVSVAMNEYKSACFNMSCHLLEMPKPKVPDGALAINSSSGDSCWVLARSTALNVSFLNVLCDIEVSPLVEDENKVPVKMKHPTMDLPIATFITSDFAWTRGGPNMLWSPNMSSSVVSCYPNEAGVRAVKTALVTVSVLLTPKSLWGGKNPTTKLVTYFVHNICHGRDL